MSVPFFPVGSSLPKSTWLEKSALSPIRPALLTVVQRRLCSLENGILPGTCPLRDLDQGLDEGRFTAIFVLTTNRTVSWRLFFCFLTTRWRYLQRNDLAFIRMSSNPLLPNYCRQRPLTGCVLLYNYYRYLYKDPTIQAALYILLIQH